MNAWFNHSKEEDQGADIKVFKIMSWKFIYVIIKSKDYFWKLATFQKQVAGCT